MGEILTKAKSVFRDFVTDGVASSGMFSAPKRDIRDLFETIDLAVYAAQSGIKTVADLTARDAFFAVADNQAKLVYVNDNNGAADDPANGVYEYVAGAARVAEGFYEGFAAVVQPLVTETEGYRDDAADLVAQLTDQLRNLSDPYPWEDWTVVVMLDANGVSHVIDASVAGQSFGYSTAPLSASKSDVRLAADADLPDFYPDFTRGILDTAGSLRLMQIFDPIWDGPVVFGAAPTADSANDQFAPPTEFIIVAILGQSNNDGRGGGGPALPSGLAYKWNDSEIVECLGDPVGITESSEGSQFPAFALEYYRRTGKGVIFIPCAVGGTEQIDTTPVDDWDATGTGVLVTQAIARINATIAAAQAASLAFFPQLIFSWWQGEQDSVKPELTKALYKEKHIAMLDALAAGITAPYSFVEFITRLGRRNSDASQAGVDMIRQAHDELTLEDDRVFMGFVGTINFASRGLMTDEWHHTQQAYNEAGLGLAERVAAFA